MLEAGGRVLDLIDLTDVYMILYLPEEQAGRAAIGAEARIILDAAPEWVAPAKVYYVAAEAQFTPKTVETAEERQKLAFQVRVRIARPRPAVRADDHDRHPRGGVRPPGPQCRVAGPPPGPPPAAGG